jgi:3-oxoacyl-[acyl-carrier protein] reductase
MELKGTVALVLGAIKGIGKGIALSLADAGVKAVLNYFDWEEELAVLEKDLDDIGQEHLILKTDLLETAECHRSLWPTGYFNQQHRARWMAGGAWPLC